METAITEKICAQLSEDVYNFDTPPEGWITLYNQESTTSSFAASAYYNPTTNEVIIAYRGSEADYDDWINNNFGGFGTDNLPPQFIEAKDFYDFIKNNIASGVYNTQIPTNTVEKMAFTGHSLGGGLAQLMGALAECSNVETYTFNGVGVKPLLDDLVKADHPVSGNYGNIHNYMVMGDMVSSLFEQVGTDNHYVVNPHPTTLKEISILVKGVLMTIYTISDQINVIDDHKISNFTEGGAFNETIIPSTYRVLFDILMVTKGIDVLTNGVIPVLLPFVKTLYGISDSTFGGVKKIFGKDSSSGVLMGGAAPISGEVSYEKVNSLDNVCNALVTLELPFIVKAVDTSNVDNSTIVIEDSLNSSIVFDSIINENEYIEAYLNGSEIIYDEAVSQDTISVYTENNDFSEITQLINNSTNLKIAIVNEDVAGNSAILGDTSNNIIEYKSGISTLMGGAGKDVYVVGDEGATIIDSDGCGTVLYNGKMLAGGIKEKGQSVYTDSSGNSYELDGSNLLINGSLTVENFDTGDMKNDRNFVVANG